MAPFQLPFTLVLVAIGFELSHSLTSLTKSRKILETQQQHANYRFHSSIPISTKRLSTRSRTILNMRDASCAYWFNVGDKVKVTSSVTKAGVDLIGRVGDVIQTWEKCDVDPTCCCAEFVDDNFAVTVKFNGKIDPASVTATGEGFIKGIDIDTFTHYFNEDELVKVKEDEVEEAASASVAFDGMSCKAFKLDQLKMGQQAQRIAAYEASKQGNE